ncbi:hypothetical protein [Streptomyces antibioticus]|uniref:hypothetical protein n=1 Tax=Streptomyces antibioticus TaxID=1890 RepID=UPI0033E5352B
MTAVYITAIICCLLLALSIVTALRDTTKAKIGRHLPAVAHCTVERCDTAGTLANPHGNWTRDTAGRHFCPAHPAAISCRICGRDKGTNRIICGPCARDENKENSA